MISRQFNEAIKCNSANDIEFLTKIYALFYSAYAEVSFQKLINTPYGFDEPLINEINKQRNLEDKWLKCIELAFKHLDEKEKEKKVNAGEIANKKKKIQNILDMYIIEPSQIRNKIAHGQWSVCLNNECSEINHATTVRISSLDFVKIDRLFTIYDDFRQCIEDIIESPKTHYRDYYKTLCKLEEYIDKTQNWSIETKRSRLLSSTKIDGYKRIRTNYEKWYEGDTYYWGLEPGHFLEELIELCPPSSDKKVLDIGCGEGKDAVYMAQKGYDVTAFDLTENGIRKTLVLAEMRNVNINAYVDDINTFSIDEQFDLIYSTGTVQYIFEENKKSFFDKLNKITKKNGIVYINVFVEKPFLELPPDWNMEEKMWKSGELFTYFADWKVERIDEVIFEDNSSGVLHYHCMDTIICRKVT